MATEKWIPNLSKMPYFNLFVDELMPAVLKLKKMPYGLLALIINNIKDIEDGTADIHERDREFIERCLYFMAGVMIAHENPEMPFTDNDVDELDKNLDEIIFILTYIELVFMGLLDAKFMDGTWQYKLPENQNL